MSGKLETLMTCERFRDIGTIQKNQELDTCILEFRIGLV